MEGGLRSRRLEAAFLGLAFLLGVLEGALGITLFHVWRDCRFSGAPAEVLGFVASPEETLNTHGIGEMNRGNVVEERVPELGIAGWAEFARPCP